ncbi:MAG: aminoglycoside phosphotransferase family protein [Lentisphaeria bacterium]|nr:aminoglycoside phosphotransferase family protein [Lentisphaeria bacterium]
MSKEILEKIAPIAAHFDLRGVVTDAEPWGSGHINNTFRLTVDQSGLAVHYILQGINQRVFPNVAKLMENIQRVTKHVASRNPLDSRASLTIINSDANLPYWQNPADGEFYRVYIFIEGAKTVDAVTCPEQAFQAAKAFGAFQCALADMPGGPLFESIVDFHHTPKRFVKFHKALAEDKLGRAKFCQKEIDFALAHEQEASIVVDLLANGGLPSRVTHNDTKINNVMLDDKTGEGVCVIDLDTCMPGSVLYDFGDEIRTTTATAAEDERDLSKVIFDLGLFEALVKGYLTTAGGFLTAEEKRLLPFSGRLLTGECGLRFLTDYLEGDTYFKIHREGHNLDRCRTQFELVRQMEEKEAAMNAFVK